MKFALIAWLTCVGVVVLSHAEYEIRTVDGKIQASLYKFEGEPIWTEEEKSRIISNQVVCGSCTIIGDSDFEAYAPDSTDVSIITQLNQEGINRSRSDALRAIELKRELNTGTLNSSVKFNSAIKVYSVNETTLGNIAPESEGELIYNAADRSLYLSTGNQRGDWQKILGK